MDTRWKSLPLRNLYYLALIIDIGTGVAIVALENYLPPVVPLFYGLPVGQDQLTSTFGLLIAPAVSALIAVINFLISFWVRDSFLRKVLAISSIILSILTTITVIKIIFLVGFF